MKHLTLRVACTFCLVERSMTAAEIDRSRYMHCAACASIGSLDAARLRLRDVLSGLTDTQGKLL